MQSKGLLGVCGVREGAPQLGRGLHVRGAGEGVGTLLGRARESQGLSFSPT